MRIPHYLLALYHSGLAVGIMQLSNLFTDCGFSIPLSFVSTVKYIVAPQRV